MTHKLECKYCFSIVGLPFDEPDLNGCYYFCNKVCFNLFKKMKKEMLK